MVPAAVSDPVTPRLSFSRLAQGVTMVRMERPRHDNGMAYGLAVQSADGTEARRAVWISALWTAWRREYPDRPIADPAYDAGGLYSGEVCPAE